MKKPSMVGALSKTLTLANSSRASSPFNGGFCSSSSSCFALKNVTKSNFEFALSDLRRLVRDADFVAVDLEMTGVTSAPWRESFEFDRYDIRYLKVKDSVEKFAVVQFGVCPFRWDHSKQSFIVHPHNFYVFPRRELTADGQSNEFLCQTTSIDFLAKYQFDFNTCIREGISYLSRAQEDEAISRLCSGYEDEPSESLFTVTAKNTGDVPLVKMADILFTGRMKNKISEWYNGLSWANSEGFEFQSGSDDSNQQLQNVFFKMRPAIKLNGFTSHQLRLIQSITEKNFKDLTFVHVNGGTSFCQHFIVYTDCKSDKNELLKEVKDSLREEGRTRIEAAVGFRHMIDLLSMEQKLIVGHNCFLDVAHIYSKFFGPLPLTAEEYVPLIHKYFPYIIDTKILLNANKTFQLLMKKNSTSLSKAFALLCPQIASSGKSSGLPNRPCVKVEVQVDDMRSSNWNSGAKHEAGYDAFMTGCVFAQACSHLGIDFNLLPTSPSLAQEEKLLKYMNHLYLSWTGGDIVDLRTGKCTADWSTFNNLKHPKVSFSNIVLIWGFPCELKASEIRECLTKVFGLNSVTSMYQLDKTAVFVQFKESKLVPEFLEMKANLEMNNYPLSVLHPLSKLLEGGETRAGSYAVYEDICRSPISKVLFADQADACGIKWKTKLLDSNSDAEMPGHERLVKVAVSDEREKSDARKLNEAVGAPWRSHVERLELFDSLDLAEAHMCK